MDAHISLGFVRNFFGDKLAFTAAWGFGRPIQDPIRANYNFREPLSDRLL